MVYNFGGGLCSGYAGNPYFNGSAFAIEHGVIVVTVSYRLGALGFLVSDDFDGPGNGGMNGIRDIAVALAWLNRFVPYFGGDPGRVTLFGQSSGSYATCTLSVAPIARGLFQRAILQSGPCFGGPPNRGWGPRNATYGQRITSEVMRALNVSTLQELRQVPAEKVQWPAYTMNDPSVAPYFSGYFEDPGLLPAPAETLWAAGMINPKSVIAGHNSKDGTAAFYGVAPTLGLVPGDKNQTLPADYEEAIRKVWGSQSMAVLQQYPLTRFEGSPQKAFLQVDADSMVICPAYQLLRGICAFVDTWSYEFAHYIPSRLRADGFGCSNGAELDVTPPRQSEYTKLFAMHGDEVKFVFGNEVGPDGLGPPNNRTICTFDSGERQLSKQMRAHWAAFATGARPLISWPRYNGTAAEAATLVFSDPAADGLGIAVQGGMHAADCDFWQKLWAEQRKSELSSTELTFV
ncbi:CES2 [Symbiodinium pilosum]|uniref:Carboxylic ester hydrolase n=1 Tax=Symbiodinium pilosum TaxID=2952 RepID=A0A812J199_SYMPI|nr:CES2 [Symbiodinium pilosum]